MTYAFLIAAVACILGVIVSLVSGILTMTRDESKYRKIGNALMRSRVLLQAFSVLFLFLSYITK